MARFSMIDVNRVLLAGRLTRDPELRYTSSGIAVATLPLAVSRKYTSKDGEKKEETCFINVVVWQKTAERCAEYLAKGRAVLVEGSLQSRSWETESGQKRSTIEVRAMRVQFMEWPETEETAETPAAEGEGVSHEEEVPF
jgi:single-strand DNA-binding protein